MRASLLAMLVAACGGTQAPPPPPAPTAAAITLDPRAAPDDAVVATVDGHPIYASCVAAQAAKAHLSAAQAVHECVDFELLARAADARGLAQDPDVVYGWRQAIASAFVAHEYEAKLTSPADIPVYDKVAQKLINRYRHDELRVSAFARVDVPRTDDATAHAVADKIAAALAGRAGLFEPDLDEVAKRIGAETGVAVGIEPRTAPFLRLGLEKPYADALFAIPEIGRASPAIRSSLGWDVILWTDVIPAAQPSDAELVAQLVPEARRKYFNLWADGLGPHVEKFPDTIRRLENE